METAKIQADWSQLSYTPNEAEIRTAALLASEGHLTAVEYLNIKNIDTTDIPLDQLKKLTSIVTSDVILGNVTPSHYLSSIISSVKSQGLWLHNMDLSEADTVNLVIAMMDRVQMVKLGDVTLDIEELTMYQGDGRCRELHLGGYTRLRYGGRIKKWAADKGWSPTRDSGFVLIMKRTYHF